MAHVKRSVSKWTRNTAGALLGSSSWGAKCAQELKASLDQLNQAVEANDDRAVREHLVQLELLAHDYLDAKQIWSSEVFTEAWAEAQTRVFQIYELVSDSYSQLLGTVQACEACILYRIPALLEQQHARLHEVLDGPIGIRARFTEAGLERVEKLRAGRIGRLTDEALPICGDTIVPVSIIARTVGIPQTPGTPLSTHSHKPSTTSESDEMRIMFSPESRSIDDLAAAVEQYSVKALTAMSKLDDQGAKQALQDLEWMETVNTQIIQEAALPHDHDHRRRLASREDKRSPPYRRFMESELGQRALERYRAICTDYDRFEAGKAGLEEALRRGEEFMNLVDSHASEEELQREARAFGRWLARDQAAIDAQLCKATSVMFQNNNIIWQQAIEDAKMDSESRDAIDAAMTAGQAYVDLLMQAADNKGLPPGVKPGDVVEIELLWNRLYRDMPKQLRRHQDIVTMNTSIVNLLQEKTVCRLMRIVDTQGRVTERANLEFRRRALRLARSMGIWCDDEPEDEQKAYEQLVDMSKGRNGTDDDTRDLAQISLEFAENPDDCEENSVQWFVADPAYQPELEAEARRVTKFDHDDEYSDEQ